MHHVKGMSTYLLILTCLLLASAISLKAKRQGEGGQQAASASSPAPLNYEFFKEKVEPIFVNRRPGRARCATCHTTNNAAFHLVILPPGQAMWTEEESRKNFLLIKQVAYPGDLESPLLTHPLAEKAGGDFFHSGGKQFASQDNPEWQTLKAFVLGATLNK
jgi:hypothetical protein